MSRLGRAEDHALWRILEITRQLGASVALQDLLSQVIDAGRDLLRADRGTVFLYDKPTHELYSTVATGSGEIRFPADKGIAGEAAQSRQVVNVSDCYADRRFNAEVDRETGYRTRCLLAVPLISHDQSLVGVLQLLNKADQCPFDQRDEQLAEALAAQCAVVLQRAMLLEAHVIKEKLERDLALARDIQSRVLPAKMPALAGYDMAGWSDPADETGGDVYDAVTVDESRVCLLLGDATGHGIGPALSVTQVRAMVRTALRLEAGLDETFVHVNNQLVDDLPSNRFVTAFLGVVDRQRHQLRYHAGGQGPIMHYHAADGAFTWLDASTFPLGIMPDPPLDAPAALALAPGDIVALCSDGIYEYANAANVQFAEGGVEAVVREHHAAGAGELIERIRQAVAAHADGADQLDDMTIVIVKRAG
ncbi:MAG: SpoIIE family protein phosphatase [Alphaproteobacteria bacterium]|nr:SpoIIE family protein phosphatase [Alphaproteobacteria bacterium]